MMQSEPELKLKQYDDTEDAFHIMEDEFSTRHTYFSEWCLKARQDVIDGKKRLYALWAGDSLAGLALVNLSFKEAEKINLVYILPEHRGRKMAAVLMDRLLAEARRMGIRFVFGQCRDMYPVMEHVLIQSGFRGLGVLYHKTEQKYSVLYVADLNPEEDRNEACRMAIRKAIEIYDREIHDMDWREYNGADMAEDSDCVVA